MPGVLQMHDPVFTLALVHVDVPAGEVNADTPVQAMIIHEEPLNNFTAIAQRQIELLKSVMRVVLDDMPENWLTAGTLVCDPILAVENVAPLSVERETVICDLLVDEKSVAGPTFVHLRRLVPSRNVS